MPQLPVGPENILKMTEIFDFEIGQKRSKVTKKEVF
jgi:hypothetical protein